jgi:LPPG:FO 2-phospho-L-lactate transferase
VKVVCLSGGVGGAKLARGLHDVLGPGELTVIGNVGDDVEVLGLHVSPDLDSVLYALAGLNDEERGWGRAGETWRTLESAKAWGGEGWFLLGDLDIGLHLVRTQALRRGETLSAITARLVAQAGLATRLLPATNDPVRTSEDEVDAMVYDGAGVARAAPGVVEALERTDLLVIAPSNPFTSILPILAVAEVRESLASRRVPSVAVSPLVGGRAVKGPVDRMLTRMAGGTSPGHVAACYPGLVDALVIDRADAPADADVRVVVAETLMSDAAAARRLAETVLEAAR